MSNKFSVVDSEEAEETDCVACLPFSKEHPLIYDDNVIGNCCRCGQQVQFRPTAPQKPPKICLPCILPEMEEHARNNELNVFVTETTVAEVQVKHKTKH